MARILVVLLALGAVYYLYKHSAGVASRTPDASSTAPIDRARRAAAANDSRSAAVDSTQAAADSSGGRVSENMTPEQVRALLGSPSDIRTETMDNGGRREIWTYASVGKTVIFENGIAVSVR